MSDQIFIPGQRWISNTEPELGLGIITDYRDRKVSISFPAAAATRTYASNNAPINRVQYQVGDEVRDSDGLIIHVTEVREEHGNFLYVGSDEDGNTCTIPELEIDSFVHFSRPQDRLFSGQVDKLFGYQLRYATLRRREEQYNNPVRGLVGARVQLLPHQLHIADEVGRRYAPRVLLADEVGLGKTIEAGLIIHQQLFTGRAERVLIIVPESLVHQWLVEMLRRFNLTFTILDCDRCEQLRANYDNPFDSAQLILCALPFLCSDTAYFTQALECDWDMVVVDEAHHLEWQEGDDSSATQGYRCVEALATRSKGLLLLTATPEQLGIESHFARLRLLDPNRYFNLQKFLAEEKSYQPVNELVQQLLADNALHALADDKTMLDQLRHYVGGELVDTLLNANDDASRNVLIQRIVQHLLDHHGTGRVLFRNTRAAVSGFPARVLIKHPLAAPDAFNESAANFSVEQQLRVEQCLGQQWLSSDPRVPWLADWLKAHRKDKVLLICHELETTLALEEYLRLRVGLRSAAFHEELTLVERDRAAAYFAGDIDSAQILVCSEIGSEGRNFQFAHHLILFDLPLNPDLLEQRIGRLARIGQRHDVQIHVPYYENTVQEKLLQWYHDGINAVEQSCPAAPTLFQQLGADLTSLLQQSSDVNAWQAFLQHTQQLCAKLLAQLAEGRDRLLELNSCNIDSAIQLIDAIHIQDKDEDLRTYMNDVFAAFDVDDEYHSANAIIIRPSEHVQVDYFPGLSDDGVTVTFDRDTALSREDMEFLTWEHPMVRGAMDMIISNEKGNSTLCTIKLPPLKPGTLLIEAIFAIHCPGPKWLQLDNYFQTHTIRQLRNESKDLSQIVSFDQLNKLVVTVDKKTAQSVIKHARKDITELLQQCQHQAETLREDIVREANAHMLKQQKVEHDRLLALAKVNPNVRPEEIKHIEDTTEQLQHHLHSAQVSLDSIRVIVCT